MEFRVTLYFTDDKSEIIRVSGASLKDVSDRIGKMVENGEVFNADGGHYHWNYNMSLVKTFHVSQN